MDASTAKNLIARPWIADVDADFADFAEELLRNRMLNELNREVIPVLLHEDDLKTILAPNFSCWDGWRR